MFFLLLLKPNTVLTDSGNYKEVAPMRGYWLMGFRFRLIEIEQRTSV